eukprot:181385_1
MSASKFTSMTSGKFSDFKKEEYHIMMNRIQTLNNILTEKCKLLSLIPLGSDFAFDFEFHAMDVYLKKIDNFEKKPRKDPLKKWWMNQKASEMASTFLAAILDKIDYISLELSRQEKSELLQTKLMKYIQFELLQCALECKFTRPRAAAASVFPNTSFQYARSRLRRKLETVYFTESETSAMKANDRKKKDEWVKCIASKKTEYKHQYYQDKLKKQKHKKQLKRMQQRLKKQKNKNRTISSSISSSITISESMGSNLSIDAINHNINIINNEMPPPPPPLRHVNGNGMKSSYNNSNTHYCAQCTSYSIQLSELTEELEQFKLSLGSTQMELGQAVDEINEWKARYNACKEIYEKKSAELKRVQTQIGSLIVNNTRNTTSSLSMSFPDCEDKMSISRGSSVNRYSFINPKDNINPSTDMSQITAQHLMHNSNSTEKMLEQLRSERNNELAEYGLCMEEENILFPIGSNDDNPHHGNGNLNGNYTHDMNNNYNNGNNDNDAGYCDDWNANLFPNNAFPPPIDANDIEL